MPPRSFPFLQHLLEVRSRIAPNQFLADLFTETGINTGGMLAHSWFAAYNQDMVHVLTGLASLVDSFERVERFIKVPRPTSPCEVCLESIGFAG